MPELSAAVKEAMQKKAQVVKQRLAGSGQDFHVLIPLTGQKAVVAPGHDLIGRCLPRWDIKNKYMKDAQGAIVVNPKYQGGPIYVEAWEHWYDKSDGKRTREWCPRSLGEEACPICEAAETLKASSDEKERKLGKDLEAKEVFLFNFIIGGTGKRALTDGGKPDIRLLPAPGTIYVAITSIMLGGESAEFARGDISDIKEGFDIKLSRPAGQGDRWKVDAAPRPSPLLTPAETAAWSGWMNLLVDIPALLEKDTKSYDALYEAFYGAPPDSSGGGEPASVPAPTVGAGDPGGWDGTGGTDEPAAEEGGGFGDPTGGAPEQDPFAGNTPFDMPDAPPARPSAPARAPARPTAAPPARRGPAPRGRR